MTIISNKNTPTTGTSESTPTQSTAKKRIEFIDLAKGVCILLIVLLHCGVKISFPGYTLLRMPLYFILSGLFFRDYGGFLQHALKKINKLLVPFIFFYVVSYVPFYMFESLVREVIKNDADGILDVFNKRQLFNGPLWFLLCLFWTNLLFCLIKLNIKKEVFRGLTVLLVGVFGVFLGREDVFLPMYMDVAMSALPYFYMGYLLTKTRLLFPNKYDRYNLLIAAACYGVTYIISTTLGNPIMSFIDNQMRGSIALNYIGSFCCVVSILIICKMIKKMPIISFCGRYSIIILCLHYMIHRPVLLAIFTLRPDASGQWIYWLTALITISVCIAMIPLCKKFIPWFTAQKDLIKVG